MSNQRENSNKPPQQRRGPGMRGPGGHGGAPVEKAKDFRKSFKRLIKYLARRKISLIIILILAAASSVFGIFGPKILGNATDIIVDGLMNFDQEALMQKAQDPETIKKMMEYPELMSAMQSGMQDPEAAMEMMQESESLQDSFTEVFGDIRQYQKIDIDFDALLKIIILVFALYVVSGLLSYAQQLIMAYTSQRTVYNMRNDVKRKLTKLPLKYFDGRTHGEVLSRVTNDIDTISNTLQQSVTQVITAVTTIIGILIMMLTISGWLTLISLVVLPLTVIISQQIIKRSQKYFVGQQKEIGNINGHVEEMYTGHKIIKAFGQEKNL